MNDLTSVLKVLFKKLMRGFKYKARQHRKMANFVVGSRVLDVGYADIPNKFLQDRYVVGFDIAKPSQPIFSQT